MTPRLLKSTNVLWIASKSCGCVLHSLILLEKSAGRFDSLHSNLGMAVSLG